MANTYTIEAVWDAEAGVYYSKSDVPGLNVETATIEEFIEVVRDVVPDLIKANTDDPPEYAISVHLEADLQLAYA